MSNDEFPPDLCVGFVVASFAFAFNSFSLRNLNIFRSDSSEIFKSFLSTKKKKSVDKIILIKASFFVDFRF